MKITLAPLLVGLAVVVSAQDGGFISSCNDVVYWGFCRLAARCTDDERAIGSNSNDATGTSTTMIDLGQCLQYNDATTQLEWLTTSIPHVDSK